MTQAESAGLRCRRCKEPARREGSLLLEEELRKAVHTATGNERGPDGHLAAPIDVPTMDTATPDGLRKLVTADAAREDTR
jgi:tRNA(Ile2) C34 agmatinyltransferase TiaS